MTQLKKTERQFLNLGFDTSIIKTLIGSIQLNVFNRGEDVPEFTLFFDESENLI